MRKFLFPGVVILDLILLALVYLGGDTNSVLVMGFIFLGSMILLVGDLIIIEIEKSRGDL